MNYCTGSSVAPGCSPPENGTHIIGLPFVMTHFSPSQSDWSCHPGVVAGTHRLKTTNQGEGDVSTSVRYGGRAAKVETSLTSVSLLT